MKAQLYFYISNYWPFISKGKCCGWGRWVGVHSLCQLRREKEKLKKHKRAGQNVADQELRWGHPLPTLTKDSSDFNQRWHFSAAYSWRSSQSIWPPVWLAIEDNLGEVMIWVRDWPWTLTPPRKATMLAFITDIPWALCGLIIILALPEFSGARSALGPAAAGWAEALLEQ